MAFVGLGVLQRSTTANSLGLVALTVACLFTRLSLGLGALALLGVIALVHVVASRQHSSEIDRRTVLQRLGLDLREGRPRPTLLISGIAIGVFAVAIVNYWKFGSWWPFSLPYKDQVYTTSGEAPAGYAAYVANHPSLASPSFLSSTLRWYLRPDGLSLSRLFPFANFRTPSAGGSISTSEISPSSSVVASMPVLCLLALMGVWVLRPRRKVSNRSRQVTPLALVISCCALGAVGVLFFGTIAERYMGDFIPTLVVASAVGAVAIALWETATVSRVRRLVRRGIFALFAVSLVWSIWANASLTYLYERVTPPQLPLSSRLAFLEQRTELFSGMFGGRTLDVYWNHFPPSSAPLGSLAVDGNCRAVFEKISNASTIAATITGVEWSADAGHARLVLSEPTAPLYQRLPLVVTGDSTRNLNVVAIRRLPGHHFDVSYMAYGWSKFFFHANWLTSAPHAWPTTGPLHLDVVLDAARRPSFREVRVAIGDDVILQLPFGIHPSTAISIGSVPMSVRNDATLRRLMALSYPEPLTTEPIPSPLCHRLVR